MTARELIAELGTYPDDARVLIEPAADPGHYFQPAQTYGRDGTVIVLIEGSDG